MLLIAGGAPAAAQTCNGMPGPRGTVELEVGGATRVFVVRLPAAYDARKPAPVVFALHPGGMNPQYMQGRVPVHLAWPEVIAIFPAALPRAGGAGGFQPSWQGRPGDMEDRDLVFFDAMIDWLRANHCVDLKKVFVMGYSNGAGLAGVLACERGDKIAGIAIASGRLSCAPAGSRPVILSHGLSDPTIRYEAGIEASRAWAAANQCAAPPKIGAPGCFAASPCSGAPLTFCTFDGGHEYNDPFTKTFADFLQKTVRK
jgi:poly(3-hydroxybutyrate) depolymerase